MYPDRWVYVSRGLGFKYLVLKDKEQSRVEQIIVILIKGMVLIFLLFEKSGYRWSKHYNGSKRKEYSLIHVIIEAIRVSWAAVVLSPWFSSQNPDFH